MVKTLSNQKVVPNITAAPPIPEKTVTVETPKPPIGGTGETPTTIQYRKITEYKVSIADSYHSVEKAANDLLSHGYEVCHVVPVMFDKVMLLGGK